MDTQLIARGKVVGIRPSTFEGKTSTALQMLRRNSKNALELMNVKLPDGMTAQSYPEGTDVEIAVDPIAVESTIYYRFVSDLKADARGASRMAPAAATMPPKPVG